MAICVFTAVSGLAQENIKEVLPTVTLRIENEARVDDRVLREARKEAIAMLSRAGIKLIWADCGNGGKRLGKPRALPAFARTKRVLDASYDESAGLEPKGNLGVRRSG